MKKISGWFFGVGAFLLPLALYLKTLSPAYIPVDSAEFALCMHTWGMCHPPGFPLYILIGKIFTSIFPFGPVIFKANLLSALFGAGTVLIVYLNLVELRVKKALGLLIALLLAVSSAFWEFSVSADVFTFATFLIAITFFFTFKKRFLPAIFTLGLSASHFYISAVLVPIIYWYFIGLKFKLREVLYSVGVFILGFFPQGLMYLRMQQNPQINWGHAQGVAGFIDYVRRKEFGNIFLIANPVLKFSIIKFLKHTWVFLVHIFTNFGVILPFLVIVSGILGFFRDKKSIFLILSFLVIITTQLFLLSTIDPSEVDSPFQISKFYLAAFVPAVLLFGLSFQNIVDKFFENDVQLPALFLGLLLIVYLFANFKANDLSKVYFSQDLVLDALEQLPDNALAITVSHVFKFGSLYEQLVNNKFTDKTVLYFPNEKNRDNESYFPDLFAPEADEQFVSQVNKNQDLGRAEAYILSVLARNLDKEVYILQGSFEERFFGYLKPFIRPNGLWWRLESDISAQDDLVKAVNLLSELRNEGVKFEDLGLKPQQQDTLSYAVAYHSTAILLASYGEYEQAIEFLNKSFGVRGKGENIQNEIELIRKTRELSLKFDQSGFEAGFEKIEELGNNLFILMNYQKCAEVFQTLVEIRPQKAESYNNLASCLASSGKPEEAKVNYLNALGIDPNLEKAKKGLEALEK